MLQLLFVGIGGAYLAVAGAGTLGRAADAIFVTMVGLGLGNGVVFQLVPQRFPREIGIVTGLVGAVGAAGALRLRQSQDAWSDDAPAAAEEA